MPPKSFECLLIVAMHSSDFLVVRVVPFVRPIWVPFFLASRMPCTPTAYYGSEYAGKPVITDTWINIDVGAAGGMPPLLLRLDDMKQFY